MPNRPVARPDSARGRTGRRTGLAALLAVGIWWCLTGPATAHSDLAGSSPADGEVVTEPLQRITFTFTGTVQPFVDGYSLVSADGSSLPIASVEQPDPTTVVVVPASPVTVSVEATWAIVSGDSHPVTGAIVVGVDIPAPTTTAPPSTTPPTTEAATTTTETATTTTDSTTTSSTISTSTSLVLPGGQDGQSTSADGSGAPDVDAELEVLRGRTADATSSPTDVMAGANRWVAYAATVALLGGTTLALVAGSRGTSVWEWIRPWLWIGAAILILTTALAIGVQLTELTGDATDLWSFGAWADVFEGRFRTGVLLRLAGAALVAVALAADEALRRWFFAIGAAAILASYPILGHVTDGSPWVAAPASMIHVAAISIWVGGLAAVLVVGARAARTQLVAVARLFSRIAGVALGATVVAGVVLTIAALDTISELWDTGYGQRLVLKVALVVIVAAIGALHHYRTIPELDTDSPTATTRFSRLALVEMIGFAAVLATTGWLVVTAG